MRKILVPAFIIFVLFGCVTIDPIEPSRFRASGIVFEGGGVVANVPILVDGEHAATTDANGTFQLDLKPGAYNIRPEQSGKSFLPYETSIEIVNQDVMVPNFVRAGANQVAHNNRLWEMFRPAVYNIKQTTGESVQLDLQQNALWYQNSQGGLIYVSLTGNFTITARVNAVKRTDNNQPVDCNVCLGGLMVRDPITTNGENYVHLVSGFTPNGLGVEYKTTVNGVSTYNTVHDQSAIHDLRIQRSGDTFTLSAKLTTTNTWTVVTTYNRPGFTSSPQIGLNIYTAQGGATAADLSVIYQNVTIE